jgi:poly(A) polymerase
MEMMNLLSLADPAPTVARMAELGVLTVVLPEAKVESLAALITEEARQDIAPDALRRLAALLPADEAVAAQVTDRFRLSTAQGKRLKCAAGRILTPQASGDGTTYARTLAYRLGIDQAIDRLLLSGASTAPLRNWQVPTFPLKGGQIIAKGIEPGPQVTQILRAVEDRWVAEEFPDAERVQRLLELTLP